MKYIINSSKHITLFFITSLLSVITIVYAANLVVHTMKIDNVIEEFALSKNEAMGKYINDILTDAKIFSVRLNHSLQVTPLEGVDIRGKIRNFSHISDGFLGIGASYEPYALGDSMRLFSPYIYRSYQGYNHVDVDYYYDYSSKDLLGKHAVDWYLNSRNSSPMWLGPFYDDVSNHSVLRRTMPLEKNGSLVGVSYTDIDFRGLMESVKKYYLGDDSYFLLMNRDGKVVYNSRHPNGEGKTHFNIIGISEENTAVSIGIDNDYFDSWNHATVIGDNSWVLLTVINKVQNGTPELRNYYLNNNAIQLQEYIPLSSAIIICIVSWLIHFALNRKMYKKNELWNISILVSLLFVFGMLLIWIGVYGDYFEDGFIGDKIHSESSINKVKTKYSIQSLKEQKSPPTFVPTGIFVQSIEFNNAYNVKITGYVWQRYDKNVESGIGQGVVFPEAETADLTESYRFEEKDTVTIGWYFESTFREKFDYGNYPFDQQLVWLRVWHMDFQKNVVLTPMISSYDNLNPGSLPGLEKEFVINGWTVEKTFYDIRENQYNTNFGMPKHFSKNNQPELYYNISLRRNFLDPFISYLFPVIVVLLMLFGVLAMTSANEEKSVNLGFNAAAALSSCSALFYVSLVSHVHLRNQLETSSMIYMEYFFLVSYVMLLLVVLNAIMFSLRVDFKLVSYNDNIIPKILYWPVLTGISFLMTIFMYSGIT